MLAEHRVRLDEMGGALRSCRALFCRMWGQGFYEPSTTGPSAAWSDFQLLLAGPDGTLWPTDLRRQPRSTAIKLLHQQADYCAALGLLVTAGEVADPASTLVRALVEYAARGYWNPRPRPDRRPSRSVRPRCPVRTGQPEPRPRRGHQAAHQPGVGRLSG